MTSAKEILKLVPTMQSAMLLNENLKLSQKKSPKVKNFAKVGIKNLIGLEFIKAESDLIGDFA